MIVVVIFYLFGSVVDGLVIILFCLYSFLVVFWEAAYFHKFTFCCCCYLYVAVGEFMLWLHFICSPSMSFLALKCEKQF